MHSTSGRLLRPKQAAKTEVEKCAENENKTGSEKYTNRTVTISKNTEMWNEVFREHQNVSPHCNGILEWDLSMEEKWGSAWRECAKCTKCTYRSKMFNLYEEVAIGLHHTPISTASYRKICMASNIPPPSVSGMQHTANAISEKVEEENMRDLQRQREKIKRIKKIRGENPDVVNIQSDCVYNNAIYSGIGRTPFQPATQCAYTVAENETYKHSIINTLPKSKLCSKRKAYS
ncbi:unnamed protein product [Mytilus coruscus]|uniref:Mutator-like transposase domain-containing protein n=1 Tax=Mytilus coruscus TaxID=42192 RepID=A0A6J8EXS5_MYTCO|nr:unnamed protein product [Mytilus coruscus]